MPSDRKLVAFSHSEVNRLNAWVRKHVFNGEGPLAVGDIVHIHNRVVLEDSEDPLAAKDSVRIHEILNDSFAEVVSVDSELKLID